MCPYADQEYVLWGNSATSSNLSLKLTLKAEAAYSSSVPLTALHAPFALSNVCFSAPLIQKTASSPLVVRLPLVIGSCSNSAINCTK